MTGDYKFGGGWGCRITLTYPEQLQRFDKDTIFDVNGHYTPIPKVGDTIIGEFEKSWMKFEFIEVKQMWNPADQFFGKVKLVKREAKVPKESLWIK